MKRYLERLNETEVAACVVAAAMVAAILMVGDALWKSVTGTRSQNARSEESPEAVRGRPAWVLLPRPAMSVRQKLRRELFLKDQHAALNLNATFPNRKTTRWS
ncbi:MAG: hypothetical protein P4N60_14445 [Verrucomicrobiae bacterium]|nr:hypothetical protein [Verrucomicrobiae bacterium]